MPTIHIKQIVMNLILRIQISILKFLTKTIWKQKLKNVHKILSIIFFNKKKLVQIVEVIFDWHIYKYFGPKIKQKL